MNTNDRKKSAFRSRESLQRRRQQLKQKKSKKREREASAAGGCQGEGTPSADVAIVTAHNVRLNKRLREEIERRKILQGENLELCRKLEKRKKTDSKMTNKAGTYLNQVNHVIESSKIKVSKNLSTNIRRIDPSNLSQEKRPVVLGEGSFGTVRKMVYREVEVAVKVLKGDASERHLIHEATVMTEIGDHPGVPFLYGVCIKDSSFMLIMQCCSQDGRVITIGDAADTLELPSTMWSQILLKLTQALLFIHTKGFVHCDLKGNNVLLFRRELIWQPVIIDYGKSVKACEAKAKPSTFAPDPRKQWCYTAPEVLSGQHPPSPASDIFSLGVIFQKINAKLPFTVVSKDTIAECCQENPLKRIKNAELLLNKLMNQCQKS